MARSISGDEDYTTALSKADILARVVDAGYYYFYAPSGARMIVDAFPGVEVTRGPLEGLEFPE
jgi:hypothetical protein